MQEGSCPRVVLIGPAKPDTYVLPKPIVVRRRVLIMGHPLTLPVLDAAELAVERAIHVTVSPADMYLIESWLLRHPHPPTHTHTRTHTHMQEGGYLDLRFVRIKAGAGILRDRYGLEGQDLRSKVRTYT